MLHGTALRGGALMGLAIALFSARRPCDSREWRGATAEAGQEAGEPHADAERFRESRLSNFAALLECLFEHEGISLLDEE
jgi:hypothetical protein